MTMCLDIAKKLAHVVWKPAVTLYYMLRPCYFIVLRLSGSSRNAPQRSSRNASKNGCVGDYCYFNRVQTQ